MELQNLIVELKKLEMDGRIVHFIWIAGKIMIDQGMNALTQGKVSINRMSVKNILKLLSLKKISLKQQDNVRTKVG